MGVLVFEKERRKHGSPRIYDNSGDFDSERVNWIGRYFAYAFSEAGGKLLNVTKNALTLGLHRDDIGHSWVVIDTTRGIYAAQFTGEGLSGNSSSASSSCKEGLITMRRFASLQECNTFGLSVTEGRSSGDKVHCKEKITIPSRYTVYVHEIITFMKEYDINYGLMTNNCQDFARGLCDKFNYDAPFPGVSVPFSTSDYAIAFNPLRLNRYASSSDDSFGGIGFGNSSGGRYGNSGFSAECNIS